MVLITATVEIAAAPEAVRAAFLDFSNISSWNTVFKSVETTKPASELQQGDKITVSINNMGTFPGMILANTPSHFSWRGSLPYIFTGDHSFKFEPSTTPGKTTFTNSEIFSGLLAFTMAGWMPTSQGTQDNFAKFANELKQHVEAKA